MCLNLSEDSMTRIWTPMPFGQYKGMTIPHILVANPHHLRWLGSIPLYGPIARDIKLVTRLAENFALPKRFGDSAFIEHARDSATRYEWFQVVVDATVQRQMSGTISRAKHLNFFVVADEGIYTEDGQEKFLECFRLQFFINPPDKLPPAFFERLFSALASREEAQAR
jgi:hypothetical protein